MKMKKLTALALAGVLCLGMSTTAFATPSVKTEDGDITIKGAGDAILYDKDGNIIKESEITAESKDLDVSNQGEDFFKDGYSIWDDGTNYASEALKGAINRAGGTVADGAQVVYLDEADITTNLDFTAMPKGSALTLKFDMSNYTIEKDADGRESVNKNLDPATDVVYAMHWVEAQKAWVCLKVRLERVTENNVIKTYGYVDFDQENGLSPVVFVATRSAQSGGGQGGGDNGSGDNGNINVRPGDEVNGSDITPDTDGKVTIDDIANAVVKKLQTANVKAVRTSTGVSPKTGE